MEYVASPADDSHEQSFCSRLSTHRRKLKDLIGDWGKMEYEDKELVFHSYLHLLYTTVHIERSKSDVNVDLGILKELQTILEQNIVDGERNYTQYQVAVAVKKIGMEGIIKPDDEFQNWIEQQLYNEDWVEYVEEAKAREPEVVKEANALGIPINEQILTLKEIRDENPDEGYCEELEGAHNMPQDNVDCIARGANMCKLIKHVISKLSRRHLVEPVDDIKERRDGVDSAEANSVPVYP
ncbi:hypothetical protein MKW98_021171 [Papaver atlanticum]|uniref:Uncharacterized protein n=1 Tax=Papaver atlanticum TaxID=357466 RepID=A0AAD4XQZ6_9MAGN|nr:hypothetical protein MKW98_021171 [Papaver atlanticum]